MSTATKTGRRERTAPGWLRRSAENLRSQMTWLDLFVGLGAVVVLSTLLLGFRYQAIPDFKPGDTATEDIRAGQDVTYEDTTATRKRKEEARAAVPAVYDLDTRVIAQKRSEIERVFETGRLLLAEKQVPEPGGLGRTQEAETLRSLADALGEVLPKSLLPVLISNRFSAPLEARILKVLETVLRSGIVEDRGRFLKDQREGAVLRDVSTLLAQPLSDAFMARDLEGAKDYLRRYELEFSDLPARERRDVMTLLEFFLVPTLVFNEKETDGRRDLEEARILPVQGQVKKGRTLVHAGEEVTPAIAEQMEALRRLHKPRTLLRQSIGFFLVVATFLYALWRYFVTYQYRRPKIRTQMVLILLIITANIAFTRILTSLADILSDRVRVDVFRDPMNLYYGIPVAFGAVLVTLLVDTNLGVFVSMITGALVGLFYGDVHLAAYVIFGSLAGIYSVRQYKERAVILKAGLTIATVNGIGIVAIDLLRQVPLTAQLTLPKLTLALVSGVLASALASMFLPALETLFKITTDIRLLEMSNLNAPILRRLSVEAPGTYHHSLMVGTLAEAAAEAIGANPLLVRVAAYYHDLGKMLKPEYFVENQIFGINKHETLSPSMSSLIIGSHVKDGLELAKEIGLSERIRDMIPQHHGTRLMTYFYQKAKDSAEARNREIVEADFRYPGPKPQSKEAAIMMMADSVEAASRTLTNPTPTQIQGMINRLVDAIIADNQFDECDITLRDVRIVKESFFKILSGIYHRRIDYPGFDFRGSEGDTERVTLQRTGTKQAKAV